jgi:hypothetical protein
MDNGTTEFDVLRELSCRDRDTIESITTFDVQLLNDLISSGGVLAGTSQPSNAPHRSRTRPGHLRSSSPDTVPQHRVLRRT